MVERRIPFSKPAAIADHESLRLEIASLKDCGGRDVPTAAIPSCRQSPTFSLLLSRAHLAIEPELIVHAEHAERRARHGFSLPALKLLN